MGPKRKILLQTGTLNFRPPVSRSKSAPRLGSIDEEEEVDDVDEVSEEEVEFSDTESLGYRTTPILGGSVGDGCSLSSQSSSTVYSSMSTENVVQIKEIENHFNDIDLSQSCPIATTSFENPQVFYRKVSMGRESLRRFQQNTHRKSSHEANWITNYNDKNNNIKSNEYSNVVEDHDVINENKLPISDNHAEQENTSENELSLCNMDKPNQNQKFDEENVKYKTKKLKLKYIQKDASFEFLTESGESGEESVDKDSLSDESGYYELSKSTKIVLNLQESVNI